MPILPHRNIVPNDDAADMPETELSDFAMGIAMVTAMVRAQAEQYERLAETAKQLALMTAGIISIDISEGFMATAESLKDSYKEMIESLGTQLEADGIQELLDTMKLHYIWVMK